MEKEYFWSIAIEVGFIQAAIWTITQEKAEVVSISSVIGWDTTENLVTAADSALSSAVDKLPEDASEPSKTVFGVPPSWVTEGQITKEYLDKIKLLCGKLSLNPTGFVVLPEAVGHLYESEEGAPLSAVILGVGQNYVDVSVFRLGVLVGTVNVSRSISIVDDVVEGLTRFSSTDALPSRFVIYDGKIGDLEETKQALIQADWLGDEKEKVRFLHTPQVEVVTPDRKMIAVSLGGAAEIAHVSSVLVAKDDSLDKNQIEDKSVEKGDNLEAPAVPVGEELGFVSEDVGVFKQQEGLDVRPPHTKKLPKPLENIKLMFLGLISRVPTKIRHNTSSHERPLKMDIGRNNLLFVGSLVFLILFFLGWWFLPKADITIFISPRKVEKKVNVTLNPNVTDFDLANHVIPVKDIKTKITADKTRQTTGTKTIGEKAKGEITIRNGSSNGINILSGTIFTGPNNLKFRVESTASVSAAVSPTTPGTFTTTLVADLIGSEYNLAKGETFQVGSFSKSEVDAVANSDFSGGVSRDIVAVSKDDLSILETDLTKDITDKAKTDIQTEVGEDEILIDSSITVVAESRKFSKKLGDEAADVDLSMTATVTALSVNRNTLAELAADVLKDQTPAGFILRQEQLDTEFGSKLMAKNGVFQTEANFVANLLPQVNPDEVAKKITAKSVTVAQRYLSTIPGYLRAEVKLMPKLPGFLGLLPRVSKNITVEISSEK